MTCKDIENMVYKFHAKDKMDLLFCELEALGIETEVDEDYRFVFTLPDGKVIVCEIGGNGQGFVVQVWERKQSNNEICEIERGKMEDQNCHEWYGKMIHDSQLAMFFANYMDDPYAVQLHVAPDKDKLGFYVVNESEKRVDFFTMDKAYRDWKVDWIGM